MRFSFFLFTLFLLACNNTPAGQDNPTKTSNTRKSDSTTMIPEKETNDQEEENEAEEQSTSYGPWEDAGDGVKIRRNYDMEKEVAGTSYVNYSSYSSGSSGGTSSESKVQLCSDMTISAYEQSSVSMYVEGADGSSSSEQSDEGTWQFYEDKNGNQYLKVNLKKTGKAFMVYKREGKKVRLGNSLYHVTQAGC